MTLVAHAGHWAVSLLQFAPVLGFLVWLGVTQLRRVRRERRAAAGSPVADGDR